jgi:hypothetical protein
VEARFDRPLSVPTAPARALSTRYLDLWLLGGASLVMWVVMFSFQKYRQGSWAIDHHFAAASTVFASLALLVNYPHFMASYKLAYQRGPHFLSRHWFQLMAMPALLLTIFAVAYASYNTPIGDNGLVRALNGAFSSLGLRTRVGLHASLGPELLGWSIVLMFVTVGWHYTKQVYGCMMVYAAFDAYPLDAVQRRLIKWNLFGIWWVSFFSAQIEPGPGDFFQFKFPSLALPRFLPILAQAFLWISFAFVVADVFVRNHRSGGRLPGPHILIPYASMYIWWLPQLYQAEFYLYVVPFFHSLQYLPFVGKLEYHRLEKQGKSLPWKGTLSVLGLIAIGFLAFELVPNSIDTWLGTKEGIGVWFFFICAHVFINVHHYFIDNALWRFDDPEVREFLLK